MKPSREDRERVLAEKVMKWKESEGMESWNPYLNIDDAYQIVEKMKEYGFTFSLEKIGEFASFRRWRVAFSYGDDKIYDGEGQVVSIAICNAALKSIDTLS